MTKETEKIDIMVSSHEATQEEIEAAGVAVAVQFVARNRTPFMPVICSNAYDDFIGRSANVVLKRYRRDRY